MRAAALHGSSAAGPQPSGLLRTGAPLAEIILLHVALLHALAGGPARKPLPPAAHEVIATFVVPEPRPVPPAARPAVPKTVPVVKTPERKPRPAPVVDKTPAPKAITTPVSDPEPGPPAPPAPPAVAAPPAPARPALPAIPKTLASGVEYLQPPRADYPPLSRRLGEQGKVMLRVLVNEQGRAERAEVQKSSGHPRLDDAARLAALRARFKPYIEDGKPVAVFVVVPISFQLD